MTTMTAPPLPLLLAVLAPSVSQAPQAEEQGSGWRATRLDLEVEVLPAKRSLAISGTVALVLESDSSKGPSLVVNGDEAGGRFVAVHAPPGASVALNERTPVREDALVAHVRFDRPFARGAQLELAFEVECTGTSSQFLVDDEVALASWVTFWYPVPMPDPTRGEPPSAMVGFPGTTRFRLPPGWTSFSNGRRTDSAIDAEESAETWVLTEPVARSFAAGRYRVGEHDVDGRTYTVCLLGREPEEARVQARSLGDAIAAMEARFGPYPYPAYAIVEVPESKVGFYGSSEQGFLMAATSAFDHGPNLPLFAHEAAHGWWGNRIGTRGPASILLSESLAQYSAVVAIETIEGPEAATEFLRFSREGYNSNQCARGYFGIQRRGLDKPLIELESGGWDHELSDSKGMWLYHMLRGRVGDRVFFATLRDLIARFSGGALTLDELRRTFVAAAPERDLERFFEQWLERPGAPSFEVEWDARGVGVEGRLLQVQDGEPYHLLLEIAVATERGHELHTVEVTGKETSIALPVEGEPLGVEIDPHHRILCWSADYE